MELKVKHLSGFNKTKGLLFAKKAYPIFFKTRFGIHTFGMKFPIDVLILSENKEVVKVAKNLLPNKFILWNPTYSRVIELPEGDIEKHKIKIGQVIQLKIR